MYIYLFVYCWSSRMTALFLYHSITPCTSKGDISASAIVYNINQFVIFGGHFCILVYR